MSRDDYISKLFIKNQDKLEEAPSVEFWSKLEEELDKTATTTTPVLRLRVWKSYAAASVLLIVLAVSFLWFKKTPRTIQIQKNEPIALNTTTPAVVTEEAEPYEELPKALDNTNNANLILEEKEKEEARAQEQRIVQAVQKRLEEATPPKIVKAEEIVMNDIVLVDEVATEAIELIEPTQDNDAAPRGAGATIPQVNFYQNDKPVAPNLNYNSNSLPQTSNIVDNNAEVEEVLNRQVTSTTVEVQEETQIKNDIASHGNAPKKSQSSSRRGSIVAKAKRADKIKSPMATAHPRLYAFGFLLGRWDDDNELEGRSYEIWSLKNRTTLVGRGYKLSKNAERIFEERLRIEYRNNQIFLVMSFEENNKQIDYMLTSFDQERFVFEQKGRSKYPDKVILQQNGLQGYSITISNSSDFLTADQQRYLEHRNRVSNVRSVRTLRQTE